jgi:polyhydroxybutyrate depolymerase
MTNSGLGPAIALGLSVCATTATADCYGVPDACRVANGTYHIVMPTEHADTVPAIMFLHGHGGDGLGTMRNSGMVDLMLERGYAVIAPDGQTRDGRAGRSWGFHPDRPSKRDEATFLVAVADDASARAMTENG